MKNIFPLSSRFRAAHFLLTALITLQFLGRAFATTITWTNAVPGDWFVASNWSPNQVPSTNDTAVLLNSSAVSNSAAVIVGNLTLSGITMTGSSVTVLGTLNWTNGQMLAPITLSTNGVGTWSGGDLNAVLTVSTNATLTMTNSPMLAYFNYAFARSNTVAFTNNGTVISHSGITGFGGAVIYNAGTWQSDTSESWSSNSTNTFINAGLFQRTIDGSVAMNWLFNSTGMLNVTPGSLAVNLWVGTNVLHGNANIGGGTGSANNAVMTVASGAVINWLSGNINADITVADNAVLNWGGGDLNSLLTVASGGILTISNSVTIAYGNYGYNRSNAVALTNNGTVISSAYFTGFGAACYNVGLWQETGAESFAVNTGTNYFSNPGTFQKLGSTFTAMNWLFNNTGNLNSPLGNFQVTSWTGASTLHGTSTISGGNGGSPITATIIIANNGIVNWTGGSMNADITVATSGVLNWGGGDLDSVLTVANDALLTISNTVSLAYGNYGYSRSNVVALTNNGTVLSSATFNGYGSVIYNAKSWQEVGSDSFANVMGTNYFINAGSLQKNGPGASTMNWQFNTTGAVNTPSGSLSISQWYGDNVLHGAANLSSGTVINAPLTLASNAMWTWSGGDLEAPLTIAAGATLLISNSVTVLYYNYAYGSNNTAGLMNFGRVIQVGDINGYGGAIFENGGSWQIPTNGSFNSPIGTNVFINSATLQKTGTPNFSFGWRFSNNGVIHTTNGTFTINQWTGISTIHGELNLLQSTLNAPVTVASNCVVNMAGGDFESAFTVAPGGTLVISNTVNIAYNNYAYSSNNAVVFTNNGTVLGVGDFTGFGNATIYNNGLWQSLTNNSVGNFTGVNTFINSGALQKIGGSNISTVAWSFNTTGTVDTPMGEFTINPWSGTSFLHGTANLRSSTINAPLTVASNAVLNMSGGDFESALTVAPGGTLALSNSINAGYNNYAYSSNNIVSLTNNGTVLWMGDLTGFGLATIYNAGLWQSLTNNSMTVYTGSNAFVNSGTLQKADGTNITTLNWYLNTTGIVSTPKGSFTFTQWTGTNTLHGTANLRASTVDAPLTIVSGAVMNLNGGDFESLLYVQSGGKLAISNAVNAGYKNWAFGQNHQVLLTNDGTVTWNGDLTGYGNTTIYNAGLWQSQGDNSLSQYTGNNSFVNSGTFQKLGGAGTGTFAWPFTTSGTFDIRSGTINLTAGGVQTDGLTQLAGGNLAVTQPYPVLDGAFVGGGKLTGSMTNNGAVHPGYPLGAFQVTGDYTQTSASSLQIQLGGATPGASFDQLLVGGTASLTGALNVRLTNGFIPASNATFTILTSTTRVGTFAGFTYPSNILDMQLNYAGNSVVLQVTAIHLPTSPKTVYGPVRDGDDIVMRFQGSTNVTYTIQATPSLAPADWQNVTNLLAPATDQGLGVGVFEYRDTMSSTSNRFYRAAFILE